MIYNNRKGFSLVELMVAIAVCSIVLAAICVGMRQSAVSTVKAKEHIAGGRIINSIFIQLKNINFYSIYDFDSNMPKFGHAGDSYNGLNEPYPYLGVLEYIRNNVINAGFDRFTVEVVYKRRDNSAGIKKLVQFTDNDSDGIDDEDADIRYHDQNNDGDYWDMYLNGGIMFSELPDTHVKDVRVLLFKQGKVVFEESQLITMEGLKGKSNIENPTHLMLVVYEPTDDSYLYNLDNGRESAYNLSIDKPYPDYISSFRADSGHYLTISGKTAPNANVYFYVNEEALFTGMCTADSIAGMFEAAFSAFNDRLIEGMNTIKVKAVKNAFTSPLQIIYVIYDLNPPIIGENSPLDLSEVKTLYPRVGALINDVGISTTNVSGICLDVLALKVNGNIVKHFYDQDLQEIFWISDSNKFVELNNGESYSIELQIGDYAKYKAIGNWEFNTNIDEADATPPIITDKEPTGIVGDPFPTIKARIYDDESGINANSIVLQVNGLLCVNQDNIIYHYNNTTQMFSYKSQNMLSSGTSCTVQLKCKNNSNDPETAEATWTFTVQY
ncbi:MAG: prepilin-type N-terminal cleavage/methylation domain-containing protein [bacterium]